MWESVSHLKTKRKKENGRRNHRHKKKETKHLYACDITKINAWNWNKSFSVIFFFWSSNTTKKGMKQCAINVPCYEYFKGKARAMRRKRKMKKKNSTPPSPLHHSPFQFIHPQTPRFPFRSIRFKRPSAPRFYSTFQVKHTTIVSCNYIYTKSMIVSRAHTHHKPTHKCIE